MPFLAKELTDERIDDLVRSVMSQGKRGRASGVRRAIKPLMNAQTKQPSAARALTYLLSRGAIDPERAREIAEAVVEAHGDEPEMLGYIGQAFESMFEPRRPNAAPVEDPLVATVAVRLLALSETLTSGDDMEFAVHGGLAVAARLLGRSWDHVAEASYRRLAELRGDDFHVHHDLAVFYKTRGRFSEGLGVGRVALELAGEANDALLLDVGICATGARDGEAALEAWRTLGERIHLGRFGLPEGRYQSVKVQLVTRPLAERGTPGTPDDPGYQETVWVDRLSPCHGVVKEGVFADLGVDCGDVVLFDVTPIARHGDGRHAVPIFPQIATLERPGYRIYRFAATEQDAGQIARLSRRLPAGAAFHVHIEQRVRLCRGCWESPGVDHGDHVPEVHWLATGKLCAPPDADPRTLLDHIDRALVDAGGTGIFVPDLVDDTGDARRAVIERRRFEMLDM